MSDQSTEITDTEARAIFDATARRKLGIGGDEFLRRWDAGDYAGPPEDPRAQEVGMLIPMVRATDDDTVIVCTEEEFQESARQSLAALGLTYTQLAEQARQGHFSSGYAHALWVSIRDTPGL